MKRRTLHSQGAGFSKAFQDAAAAPDAQRLQFVRMGSVDGVVSTDGYQTKRVLVHDDKGNLVADACLDALVWRALQNGGVQIADGDRLRVTVHVMAPVCDRSGDVGSRHYWPDGAQVGDWCRCGKRKRFLPSG